MDPAACPACGGVLAPWRSVPSAEPGRAACELARCRTCGSAVTLGGHVEDIHDSGAYRPGTPRLYRFVEPLLNRFDRRRLALLAELEPPPAVLVDAGAGRGRFVLAAAAAGYSASGVEPSARGIAAARAIGAAVAGATIASAPLAPGSVDAVSLWHVLEHIEDPGAAVERLASWLRPGGALLVAVPNLGSLQARIGGGRWYHLDVPRHRVHFTVAGVRALLAAHGFEVVRIEHRLLEHNPFGMWQTLVNSITRHPSYLYNLLKRNVPVRSRDLPVTLLGLAVAPLAALAELAAAASGRGGTIAVLARRAGQLP